MHLKTVIKLKAICTISAAGALCAAHASAETLRDLCADRPGLGAPACTMDRGHAAIEIGIADWTRADDTLGRTDRTTIGEALLRYGLDDRLEVQIGWSAFNQVRERNVRDGTTVRTSGSGDLTLALRRNLRHPDGSGLSVAVMPYVLLPVGRSRIGAGDWGAGLMVPFSLDLGHGFALAASPWIEAAVDEDGKGRHLGFGSVAGVQLPLGADWSLSQEISLYRNKDPDSAVTEALDCISLAWTPTENIQWDFGMILGLNGNSPDMELSVGYVVRF